jgi:hypothetical protein
MLGEQAFVSFATRGPVAGVCELCTAEVPELRTVVVVRHPRGGSIELAACGWCAQALRRLAALSGGVAAFALEQAAAANGGNHRASAVATRRSGPPVLIRELDATVRDADGTPYVALVYGRARADDTWECWIDFVAIGARQVRQTDRETTQSKYEDLAYWAAGLEPAYLEGAFNRARPIGTLGAA